MPPWRVLVGHCFTKGWLAHLRQGTFLDSDFVCMLMVVLTCLVCVCALIWTTMGGIVGRYVEMVYTWYRYILMYSN